MTTFGEAKTDEATTDDTEPELEPDPVARAAAAEALVLAPVSESPVTAIAIEVKIEIAMVLVFMHAKLFARVSVEQRPKNIGGKASYANELLKT